MIVSEQNKEEAKRLEATEKSLNLSDGMFGNAS
jgi:hypothetical protein